MPVHPKSTAFLRRPKREPLELDPEYPFRRFLSVVKQWAKREEISLDFICEIRGPQHKPLWVVIPVSKLPVCCVAYGKWADSFQLWGKFTKVSR